MKKGSLGEKILFSRLKAKDKEAFIKAYDLYIDSIYRYIYFKVSSQEEAQDLTSEVFLKTWNYIQNNSIKDYKTLRSLLYKIARNLVIDYYRKKSRQQDVSFEKRLKDTMVDESQETLEKIEITVDYQLIEKKILLLKDDYRDVLILRYINELSIAEIARVLDKTNNNIRVLIFRSLKALKEIIDEDQSQTK